MNFKQAHDSVRMEVFCNILIEFGNPMYLVRLIKMCLNETCSRVWVGSHLSDMFPIWNGLKQGDVLLPLLFDFALEYASRRVQVNQDVMNLIGKYQLLVHATDDNTLGRNVHTIKKNTEALVVASKETGPEINVDKTEYMVISRDQIAGRNRRIKTDNGSFQRVEQFKHLGTTLTNQNSIKEEMKSRLKSGSACYHSV